MVQTLDVGCGDRPKGNVNLDRNVGRTEELYFQHRKINPKQIPNFIQADAHYLPFRKNSFNKVYCFHTLEHLADPIKVLKEIIRVVNGEIEIRLPNHYHERFQCMFVPQRRSYVKRFHKHSFCKKDLERMGFVIYQNFYIFNILSNLKLYFKNCRTPRNFLTFLFYSIGSTFFPFIPDELHAHMLVTSNHENQKPNNKK